jgi:hypothetical protein
MRCFNHPGCEATGVCANCGRFVCDACKDELLGKCYCSSCKTKVTSDVNPVLQPPETPPVRPPASIPTGQRETYFYMPPPPPPLIPIQTLVPREAATPDKSSKRGSKKPLVIGGIAGAVVIIAIIGIVLGLNLNHGNGAATNRMQEIAPTFEADFQKWMSSFGSNSNQSTDNVTAAIRSSGLPVTGAYVDSTNEGKKILLVDLDYSKLPTGSKPGSFIVSAEQSLVKIALIKTINLTGIYYVTVILKDTQGRIIIQAGALSSDMIALGKGTLSQSTFISRSVAKVEDRFAAFDAMKH